MDKLEDFKTFAKANPHLNNYVINGQMTWQNFYEMYDMYGEKHSVWNNYKEIQEKKMEENNKSSNFNDIMNMAKNLDVKKVQSGINSIQKLLGLAGDFFIKDSGASSSASSYKPRPIYQRFDD